MNPWNLWRTHPVSTDSMGLLACNLGYIKIFLSNPTLVYQDLLINPTDKERFQFSLLGKHREFISSCPHAKVKLGERKT